MDAATVTVADFGNAGDANVTIGTVTETSPGVVTVQATPTTAGTLILRVNADAVLQNVAGSPLYTAVAIPDDTTITVNTPVAGYATWSGGIGFEANLDTNNDGVKNGVAWALNAAGPNANAVALLPTSDNTDPDFFIFTFNRSDTANGDANTTIAVQYGSDLSGWTTAVHDGTNTVITLTPGSPSDEVQVKLRRSVLAPTGKIFARLNVVVTP